MNNLKIVYLIALLEGYLSISTEIMAIRRFTPYFGSALPETSIIIGIFLLFLSIGYSSTEKIKEHFSKVITRNFFIILIFYLFTFQNQLNDMLFIPLIDELHISRRLLLTVYTLLTIAPNEFFLWPDRSLAY